MLVTTLAANAWIYGIPLVILSASLLHVTHRLPARLRFVLVLVAFGTVLLLPLIASPVVVAHVPRTSVRAGTPGVWQNVVPAVWVLVACILIVREVAGHLRLRTLRAHWRPASPDLRRALLWPADVPLLVSDRDDPMTVGVFRPAVALPAAILDRFSVETARRIARHELAHWRWRDPAVHAAMRAIACVFWIAPLWPFVRWARREREAAADDHAMLCEATAGAGERLYLDALITLARGAAAPARGIATMAGSDLEYRARRILSIHPSRVSLATSLFLLLGSAFAVANVVPIPLVTFAPQAVTPVRAAIVRPEASPVPTPPTMTRAARRSEPPFTLLTHPVVVDLTPATPAPQTASIETILISNDRHVDIHRDVNVDRHADVRDDGGPIVIRSVIRRR